MRLDIQIPVTDIPDHLSLSKKTSAEIHKEDLESIFLNPCIETCTEKVNLTSVVTKSHEVTKQTNGNMENLTDNVSKDFSIEGRVVTQKEKRANSQFSFVDDMMKCDNQTVKTKPPPRWGDKNRKKNEKAATVQSNDKSV